MNVFGGFSKLIPSPIQIWFAEIRISPFDLSKLDSLDLKIFLSFFWLEVAIFTLSIRLKIGKQIQKKSEDFPFSEFLFKIVNDQKRVNGQFVT